MSEMKTTVELDSRGGRADELLGSALAETTPSGGAMNARVVKRLAIVLGAVAIVTVAHLTTPRSYFFLHSAFQHLYYLPIILGAVFFGWAGGILTAVGTAICYAPHIHHWQETNPDYVLNQYAELGSFFLVGLATGLLADRERRRGRQLEQKSAELERANKDLEDSFQRAKRADRLAAVGQLAAGLAHEIRHPLASIEGAVNVLANPESPDELQEEFRGIIKKECRRLGGLLTELLDFARPREPRFRRLDIASSIEDAARLARSSLGTSNVNIETKPAENLPTVECDEEQIKQVLLNLLMNAAQAMPDGGRIVVSASREGRSLALIVADDGPGIPGEMHARIFDPFFTTREAGTGLGLAVVQQIVTQHGGQIDVEQNGAQGARFVVRIPMRNGRRE
jgi:signal transduction histidine kinase